VRSSGITIVLRRRRLVRSVVEGWAALAAREGSMLLALFDE
jgi:hypothetical protein